MFRDMFDGLWEAVVAPLDAIFLPFSFVQDALSGGYADFGVDPTRGQIRIDVVRILDNAGIHYWGLQYSREMLRFTVSKRDARRTYQALKAAGVPVLYAPEGVAGG